MKTGTITFHVPNNNGSFFQAHALQTVLQNQLKYSDATSELLQKKIDYTLVREKLDKIRENGIRYLKEALLD